MPEVSVIMPAYNAARHIGRAVQSVLAQTVIDIELIVIDDASDDDTAAVAAASGKENVKIIRHASNKGVAAARNSGIQAARGNFMAFLDSDDVWHPDKLEKQLPCFADSRNGIICVFCGYSHFDSETGVKTDEVRTAKSGRMDMNLLLENCVTGGSSTVLIPKAAFEHAGLFDETLRACEDWDLWLRLAQHGQFDFLPNNLCDIYMRPDSLSADQAGMLECGETLLAKHEALYRAKPRILALRYYALGLQNAKLGLKRKAADYFSKARALDECGPLFDLKCSIHSRLLRAYPGLYAGLLERFY